jgi:hypothetical protein
MQIIPPESARTFKLMIMTGSKKYSPVGTKAQSRVGLDFCADSWFLESNGKMVQLGFSLITTKGKRMRISTIELWFF